MAGCLHRRALDPPAGGRAADVLNHAVDQPAYIADQAMIMAEEYSEHLGEDGAVARPMREDDLAVRQAQQQT
jgi:hypothetical protein